MSDMTAIEAKAFVPSRDFAVATRFYQDLGFDRHLLVEDVDAWWRHVQTQGLAAKYAVQAEPPADRPWGMRDFVMVDPTGVLWRIAQNKAGSDRQT
jgi:uncharacterized glyoxalase superfamily protein PhnB